jgi:hypothetical protein
MDPKTGTISIDQASLIFPTYLLDLTRLEDPRRRSARNIRVWPGGRAGIEMAAKSRFRFNATSTAIKHFRDQLHRSWSVLDVLEDIVHEVAPEHRLTVSTVIEKAYWSEHGAVLVHPYVRRLLDKLVELGESDVLDAVNECGYLLQAHPMANPARLIHRIGRLRLLGHGVRGVPEQSVGAGEFLMDYLLMQRAIAEIVRISSRKRAVGESTAERVDRMCRAGETHAELTQLYLTDPLAIAGGELGTRDPQTLDRLLTYATTRTIPTDGVLAQFLNEPLPAGTSTEGP